MFPLITKLFKYLCWSLLINGFSYNKLTFPFESHNITTLKKASFKSVFLAGFPMNLIGLPAEGGKCGSLLPDGVGARGLYTRIWDSR